MSNATNMSCKERRALGLVGLAIAGLVTALALGYDRSPVMGIVIAGLACAHLWAARRCPTYGAENRPSPSLAPARSAAYARGRAARTPVAATALS